MSVEIGFGSQAIVVNLYDPNQLLADGAVLAAAVSGKANIALDNVPAEDFGEKEFPATPLGLVEPVARSMADRLTQDLFVAGKDFPIAVDGSTNDQPILQSLSDYARTNSRAIEVILPTKGSIGLGAALSINSDYVTFRAGGAGYSHDVSAPPPLGFVPVGGYTGTALFHGSVIGATNPVIIGGGFNNLSVLGLFSRALHVRSVQFFDTELYFGPVSGTEAVLLNCLLDYRAGAPYSQLGEAGDNQNFRLRLRGRLTSEGGGNDEAHGLVFGGAPGQAGAAAASGNTSVAHDTWINIRTHDGHAFVCDNADEVTVNIRHLVTGTGRPAYIKGNRTTFTAPGFGLGTGINIWYTSANAALYEGTDTVGNDSAASGKVALDRGNNTPYPITGTGAKPLIIDAEAIIGAYLRNPIMAGDGFTTGVTAAALGGAGAAIGDAGSGALLLRLVSGGLIRFGEDTETVARILLGGGLTGARITGSWTAQTLSALAGGLRTRPAEGWVGTVANGEMTWDVQEVTSTTSNIRFYYRRVDGTNLQLGSVALST
jgi:hypothetical protein